MNSLSWFLYWSEVISSFRTFLMVGLVGCGLGLPSILVLTICRYDGAYESEKPRILQNGKSWATRLATGAVILAVVLTVVPKKETLYAIAAVEVGERVVNSEAVQGVSSEALKALQNWIKKQGE